MIYRTRKMVKPGDLNPKNTLFGGRALEWLDEECAIYVACQLGTFDIVTKFISEINFTSPARQGDIVEIGVEATNFGTTSITLRAELRNKNTQQPILKIEKIVFVAIDEEGKPKPHGKTEVKA